MIVVGVRATLPRLRELIHGKEDVMYCLPRLTRDQAIKYFPRTKPLLVPETTNLEDLLLTPLILTAFEAAPGLIDPVKLTNRSALLEQALTAIIEAKELPRVLDANGLPLPSSRWLDALTLIGWQFFSLMRGKMSGTAIAEADDALIHGWNKHLSDTKQQQTQLLLQGFELAGDQSNSHLLKLFMLTVFATTSDGDYRFRHREWEDYLASRYLTLCVRYRFADQLGRRSSTMEMFQRTGEQLQAYDVTEVTVDHFFNTGQTPANEFIVGNFSAVLGNSFAPVSRPALEKIFQRVADASPMAQHVCSNTFAARALRNHPSDLFAADIRAVVHDRFLMHDRANYQGVNPLTRRMMWCYSQTLSQRFRLPGPVTQWEGVEYSPDERAEILTMLRDNTGNPEAQSRKDSLQIAWLRIQNFILVDPERAISAVFYLYPITFAYLDGTAVEEVREQLPLILNDERLQRTLDAYTIVPQLSEIRNWCRQAVALGDAVKAASPSSPAPAWPAIG